jgi:hypothetical protein
VSVFVASAKPTAEIPAVISTFITDMAVSVRKIQESFFYLFESLHKPAIAKSLKFHHWNEKELLPLVRTYLLGCFKDKIEAEHWVDLPGSPSGWGAIDFIIEGIGVELAVRSRNARKATLSPAVNRNEIKKLMKHSGKGLLVLFDFSGCPLSAEELQRYRTDLPKLGKGHRRSPFQLSYFCRRGRPRVTEEDHLRIRV